MTLFPWFTLPFYISRAKNGQQIEPHMAAFQLAFPIMGQAVKLSHQFYSDLARKGVASKYECSGITVSGER